jgi:hypothetical protein
VTHVCGPNVCVVKLPECQPVHGGESGGFPCRIFRVDHSSSISLQEIGEPELCFAIRVHVGVIVEMLVGKVREHRDRELQCLDPTLVERVRRYLHG